MFSSTISVPNISKEVTNTNMIPPPGQVEEEDQLIFIENVMDTSPKRMRGIGGTAVPRFPPLPMEMDLFIPPVEKGNRAERSILVLTETFLSMMPQEGREVVKIKETASIIKTSIKRVYTICNCLQ